MTTETAIYSDLDSIRNSCDVSILAQEGQESEFECINIKSWRCEEKSRRKKWKQILKENVKKNIEENVKKNLRHHVVKENYQLCEQVDS